MEDLYLDFYRQINAQKQLDNIKEKFKDKKIVIYGAGLMSQILFKNFDLSKLNIIAICDNKYNKKSDEKFFSYSTLSPNELKESDFDIIFVNLRKNNEIIENIKYKILINSANEDKLVLPILKVPFGFLIRKILF